VPPEADALVARCLQPDPANRFTNASTLLKALPSAPGRSNQATTLSTPARRQKRTTFALATPTLTWAAWAFAGLAILALVAVASMEFRQPEVLPPEPPRQTETALPPGATPSQIVIDAIGPPAQVYRNGQLLGTTPLTLSTYIGEPVDVELRRGAAIEPLHFQTTPGKRAYTVTLSTP
jgi:hypothetical protein